jgi:hypothetical protein
MREERLTICTLVLIALFVGGLPAVAQSSFSGHFPTRLRQDIPKDHI